MKFKKNDTVQIIKGWRTSPPVGLVGVIYNILDTTIQVCVENKYIYSVQSQELRLINKCPKYLK